MEYLTLYQRKQGFSIEKQNIWLDEKNLLHIKKRICSKLKTARKTPCEKTTDRRHRGFKKNKSVVERRKT